MGQRFNSISHAANKKEHMAAFHETAQASNMRNSEKRKIKRSFPRPKASNILGLNQEGPISMQNTISTTGNPRVELLAAGKDVNNIVSSIDNSSVE